MESDQTTQNNQPNAGAPVNTNPQPVSAQPAQPVAQKKEYQGWLNSNSFFKRAFAIWGYHFVANFIIGLVMSIIFGLIFATLGIALFGSMFKGMGSNQRPGFNVESFINSLEGLDSGAVEQD